MRLSRRRLSGTLFVAALSCAATVSRGEPATIAAQSAKWRWITDQHFEMLTNSSERRGREAIEVLESFRAAISQLLGGAISDPPGAIRVALFDRTWDFTPYMPPELRSRPELLGGYFHRLGDANYMALTAEWREAVPRIVLHEYSHLLIADHLGRLPIWLNEGLAEYFSAFHYSPRARRVEIGRPIPEHMQLLNSSNYFALERLLQITYDSPDYADERNRFVLYAKAWLTVHYLQLGSPERAGSLARFAQNLAAGQPQREALEKAAGCTLAELDAELLAYQRKSLINYSSFKLEGDSGPSTIASHAATTEDALYRLGELLQALGPETQAEAQAHFDAAHRPAPPPPSFVVRSEEFAAADRTARDAAPMASDLPLEDRAAVIVAGNAGALDKARFAWDVRELAAHDRTAAQVHFPVARRALLELLAARPADFNAASNLRWFYTAASEPAELAEGLAAFEAAYAAAPDAPAVALGLSDLLERTGNVERATSVVEAVLSAAPLSGGDLAQLEDRANDLAYDEARRLLHAGKAAEAETRLAARAEATRSPEARALADQRLKSFRAESASAAIEAEYRRGVALVNAQKVEAGAEVLRRVVREHPDSDWAELARRDLETVDAYLAKKRARQAGRKPPPPPPPPPSSPSGS